MAEIGENVVGCYLRLILDCEIVVYNQKIFRQGEVDVIGIDLDKNIIYLCEVTTHILGLGYGKGYQDSINKIKDKFTKDIRYSKKLLPEFKKVFLYWSPNVPRGIVKLLENYKKELDDEGIDFKLIINNEYTKCVNQLMNLAKKDAQNRGEPFYRVLQILGHLKKSKN